MNFKLLIQFDGTDFHGWQVQDNKQRTVQGELERVLTKLNGGETAFVKGSGRTDAGVHAEGFVANVQLKTPFSEDKLLRAINGNLRSDVRILQVEEVSDDFHARFNAKGKTYVYRVINSHIVSPFWSRYALQEGRFLDIEKMKTAAQMFVGKHDWRAFSAAKSDVKDRVRTITEFSIESNFDERAKNSIIEFRLTGNGFLRYMVRSIVGTLLEVGRGEKDFATIQRAIETGDRSLAGMTSPAHGLTLLKVYYD